jgi:hypothetical protein
MPSTLFDAAGLAVVAFAEVVGATGASVDQNSGVVTTRTAAGTYTITLPADKAQSNSKDLIFVTPIGAALDILMAKVSSTSTPTVKTVYISNATTLADGDFTVLILRTIAP